MSEKLNKVMSKERIKRKMKADPVEGVNCDPWTFEDVEGIADYICEKEDERILAEVREEFDL